MLFVRSANVQKRYLARQGFRRFLPLRARRTFVLDWILHVSIEFEVHDLQGQQPTTGKYIGTRRVVII